LTSIYIDEGASDDGLAHMVMMLSF